MKKTDNSYFNEKVMLRINHLPKTDTIRVLDCFSGTGSIWKEVKKRTGRNIITIGIEIENGKNNLSLKGKNNKYLSILDLSKFNIIDLDAYGVPFSQLEILFKRKYKGIVFVTAIQSGMGKLPNGMLQSIGYTDKMIKKIPTLFNTNFLAKLKQYLYLRGVRSIDGYFIGRKNYFVFNIN